MNEPVNAPPIAVPPTAVTVAVKFNVAPASAGFASEITTALVAIFCTVSMRVVEVLPALFVSPA